MGLVKHKVTVLLVVLSLVALASGQNDKKAYFWQLNDLHYDPTYLSSQASCNEPIDGPGKYGDYRCDAPWELIVSAVKALVNNGREPEFIMWSGDLSPHWRSELEDVDEDLLLDITQNVTTLLLTAFPEVPILPVIGNHDYVPRNQLLGSQTSMYEKLAEVWAPLFNDSQITSKFKDGGYYSKLVSQSPAVRAVVPNSNLYYTNNPLDLGEDPGEQFQWLDETLTQAQQQGEKVYLLTHISPGMMSGVRNVQYYKPEYNARFLEILQKHGSNILGVFTGHSHFDSFKMVYSEEEAAEPLTSVFVAPSVTPWKARLTGGGEGQAHNPAVRKVWIWQANNSVENIEQFYLDLPRANGNSGLDEWKRLYIFKNLYNIGDMTAQTLDDLLSEMRKYASNKFHTYYDMHDVSVIGDEIAPPCGCACKSDHLCAMEFIEQTAYEQCVADEGYTCGGASLMVNFALLMLGTAAARFV